ncbi:hypothetical protein LCGC14_1807460 [marine sediment metagenome]|uniref:Uncharacterized protein n=1 Tax=marine sediment metagenome TaxID=412755 RepID=A0A0F9GMM1_9ZZZZ
MSFNLTPGVYAITCPASPFQYLTYRPVSPRPYIFHTVTDRATVLALIKSGDLGHPPQPHPSPPRPRAARTNLAVVH